MPIPALTAVSRKHGLPHCKKIPVAYQIRFDSMKGKRPLLLLAYLFLLGLLLQMSKRKVIAGGYEDSDDEISADAIDVVEPFAKRIKTTSHALPRLSALPTGAPGSFQFPRAGSSSRTSTLPQPSLVPARPTPEPAAPSLESESNLTHISNSSAEAEVHAPATNPAQSTVQNLMRARSALSLERQVNSLATTLDNHILSSYAQQTRTDKKLTHLTDVLEKMISNLATIREITPSSVSLPAPPSNPPLLDQHFHLPNPVPTSELVAIVSKVVSEMRSRVGKKKAGAEDNSMKEHARNTFYRMLDILASRSIRPYFEDAYGEPDTLPVRFADPETGYCRPYPHWKYQLTKQVAWVPTYISRFRSTIPNNQSELSLTLSSLSDEQIVILLNDGPFKTAQTVWREMKKTDAEIEVMRSNARKYQRSDRKALVRSRYIKNIPGLQGLDWECLYHSGYVSSEESDDEGEIVVKRPEYRAVWVNSLYEAIRTAELEKAQAKSGLCPRLPPRRIEAIPRPVPQLERGTGAGKLAIRIPVCAFGKAWQASNGGELKKYSHLINTRLTSKPDITAFLAEHPMPALDLVNPTQHDVDNGIQPFDGDLKDGDESGVADQETDMVNSVDETEGSDWREIGGGKNGSCEIEVAQSSAVAPTFPIDPQLESSAVAGAAAQPAHRVRPRPIPKDATPESAPSTATGSNVQGALSTAQPENLPSDSITSAAAHSSLLSVNVPYNPSPWSDMPSPPPLAREPPLISEDSTTEAGPTNKRTRRPKNTPIETPATLAPKKRGRPPGSKNRKQRTG